MVGRETAERVRDALDRRDYERAGEIAIRGAATPIRVAGESLQALLEVLGRAPSAERRDEVVLCLEETVPALVDAVLALYANVIFAHAVQATPHNWLEKIRIPPSDVIERLVDAELDGRGRGEAIGHYGQVAPPAAGESLALLGSMAAALGEGALDGKALPRFFEAAGSTAVALIQRMTTLRVALVLFRGY